MKYQRDTTSRRREVLGGSGVLSLRNRAERWVFSAKASAKVQICSPSEGIGAQGSEYMAVRGGDIVEEFQ